MHINIFIQIRLGRKSDVSNIDEYHNAASKLYGYA